MTKLPRASREYKQISGSNMAIQKILVEQAKEYLYGYSLLEVLSMSYRDQLKTNEDHTMHKQLLSRIKDILTTRFAILKAISKLPSQIADVITMHYIETILIKDIATELDLTKEDVTKIIDDGCYQLATLFFATDCDITMKWLTPFNQLHDPEAVARQIDDVNLISKFIIQHTGGMGPTDECHDLLDALGEIENSLNLIVINSKKDTLKEF